MNLGDLMSEWNLSKARDWIFPQLVSFYEKTQSGGGGFLILDSRETKLLEGLTIALLQAACNDIYGVNVDPYQGGFHASLSDEGYRYYLKQKEEGAEVRDPVTKAILDMVDQPEERKSNTVSSHVNSKRVFIVHGHDEDAKKEVAYLASRLKYEPIILHEQPNRGRTIIEKFEDYSDVPFAVVLLTPDDVGYSVKDGDRKRLHRARQNVVLELGFFMGKLGRKNVIALVKPRGKSMDSWARKAFEISSDYLGVLYIAMDDNGHWQLSLAKEMLAAGLDVDLNDVPT